MMELEKLRKADIFSGSLILILGLFIISQALQMPMKDSWGGVQNVWFVSPALFPLLIGGMLAFLGTVLIAVAFKSVGMEGVQSVLNFLKSAEFLQFLQQKEIVRFYGIVFNLTVFVFLMIPRIDFFPASILFLLVFFFMFYLGDHSLLMKIFRFTLFSNLLLCLFLFSGLGQKLTTITDFGADWLVLLIIFALCMLAKSSIKAQPELNRRYRLCLIIAFAAPFTIGIIFKYLLLVPMPYEGLIVQLLDSIWYADFWS